MHPEKLMHVAIELASRGIDKGQSPFGCVIAIDGVIVSACHNTVWMTTDITAHAEINALREACRSTSRILLEGAIVATTCEPCPMCMSALHWARVDTVYFGATIEDAEAAGFNELSIPAAQILKLGGSGVKLHENILRRQCADLFWRWKEQGAGKAY